MVVAVLPLLAAIGVLEIPQASTMLGWTADGQSLVWSTSDVSSTFPKHYFIEKDGERVEVQDPSKLTAEEQANMEVVDEGEMMGAADPITDETATVITVHDVRTGVEQKFLASYKAVSKDGAKKGELKKKYAGLADAKAYDAWKKAHPLAKLTAAKKSKTGSISITVTGEEASGAWKGNTYSWQVTNHVDVKLGTVCGSDKAVEAFPQEMAAMYEPHWSATPYWEPTGHRVLFLMKEAVAKTMRGEDGGNSQFVVVACGPRVDIVAPAGLEGVTGKVADAVEKAGGYTVISVGPAKAARTATVIYADDAHMDAAQKLVAAIPGGATVEKLTWKPKSNIVVALGDSAK